MFPDATELLTGDVHLIKHTLNAEDVPCLVYLDFNDLICYFVNHFYSTQIFPLDQDLHIKDFHKF